MPHPPPPQPSPSTNCHHRPSIVATLPSLLRFPRPPRIDSSHSINTSPSSPASRSTNSHHGGMYTPLPSAAPAAPAAPASASSRETHESARPPLGATRLRILAVSQPADVGTLVKGRTIDALRLRCRSQYVAVPPPVGCPSLEARRVADISRPVSAFLAGMKRSTGLT